MEERNTQASVIAAARGERQWARSAQTRTALLDAARDVCLEYGFAGAGINAIVERSGVSVGSIYHHFGGKGELFLALWEQFEDAAKDVAREAVAVARRGGEQDPVELFVAGTRAYLNVYWEKRQEAALFLGIDAPPGFETAQRRNVREWLQQNAALLGGEDEPFRHIQVMALTSIVGDAKAEISTLDDRSEAETTIEAIIAIVRKVAT